MKKRGQFFLLAAVIISAVIISMGVGTNRAIVNDEPDDFYDFSYEVKREVGAVLDYEVYSGMEDGVNLEEFVDLLAEEVQERSPGSDFIFIYGTNASDMKLKNYGSESVYSDGREIEGFREGAVSRICLESSCQALDRDVKDFSDLSLVSVGSEGAGAGSVLVEVSGSKFEFPFLDRRQVIFIMQKNIGGDRHIIVG